MTDKIKIKPHFCEGDPANDINWSKRDATIKDRDGNIIFRQDGVEFPDFWSDRAVKIVTDKYFRGIIGTDKRETSLRQVVNRIVDTITKWGVKDDYFDSDVAEIFSNELKYLLYNQYAAFNSPVYFNVGIKEDAQIAACFLIDINDSMESIMELATTEAMIFKSGSGAGSNLSNLRGKDENLSGGGKSSGPVSFMRGYDSFAGAIRSGGATRRSAKMTILDIDHLDIMEFINCKTIEEEKIKALVKEGYNPNFEEDNSAPSSVAFQNENHSVRVFDEFMEAVISDNYWELKPRIDKTIEPVKIKARELFNDICKATYECGDPGLFFNGVSNLYHTCPKSGEINTLNPCAEVVNIPDSSCNLVSMNLKRFVSYTIDSFAFDIESYVKAIFIMSLAQEIMISNASYPTKKITENTLAHRQLGLGFTNLGALLMYCGLPYDSDEGRSFVSAISSLTTASVYKMSTEVSKIKGSFDKFKDNKEDMRRVLIKHQENIEKVETDIDSIQEIINASYYFWGSVLEDFDKTGIRNSQATACAPAGTISFMMDADTTGVEPELFLIKTKTMVGGGIIKIVNETIGQALINLKYNESNRKKIMKYLHENETLDGCPYIKDSHIAIFDTSYTAKPGGRRISTEAHVKMLGAVQPHISGGISKTVNVPREATVQDIWDTYLLAYKLGVKAISIFREGSKSSQPLTVKEGEKIEKQYGKRSLPDERDAKNIRFKLENYVFYLNCGFYNDGTLGEIFIRTAKEGSMVSGLLDTLAILTSISLQHGVPLKALVNKFSHVKFEPSGFTGRKDIPYAKSIVDLIFRYLDKYIPREEQLEKIEENFNEEENIEEDVISSDNRVCSNCGNLMVRRGTCYYCQECFESSGCS